MAQYFRISIVIVLFLLGLNCCSTDNNQSNTTQNVNKKKIEKNLVDVNKILLNNEKEDINNFIERYDWDMIETGTGLRYMVYEKGNGPEIIMGERVSIYFSVQHLNGTILYTSESDGIKEFEVGHGGVESGLEEAILLLHKGDKAKLIIPSHLAFGFLGDENKIPKRTTLVYDLQVLP